MPFYEYVCTECGKQTEVLQRLSDPPETECPSCHQPALIKQVSAAGFRLKGSGWYETDFKSGNKRNLEGDSAGAPATASKDADSKSESKSDAKASADGGAKSEAKKPEGKSEAKPAKVESAAASAPAAKPSDTKTPA